MPEVLFFQTPADFILGRAFFSLPSLDCPSQRHLSIKSVVSGQGYGVLLPNNVFFLENGRFFPETSDPNFIGGTHLF